MILNFIGDISSLSSGIAALLPELDCSTSTEGIPVSVQNAPGDLKISYRDGCALISYEKRHHFFRGLGLLVKNLRSKQEFNITETPQFSTIGPIFDVSRNAVITVDTYKLLLRKLALMGMNTAMLYMEDVYEIPNQPYFGYMRGRYTKEELQSIDDYANQFDIEVIPSIQTLAHLDEFLKWDATKPYRDTRGVLLADADATYELIDKMLSTFVSTLRSRRVHIGMDESEDLGRGRHLDKNGYEPRFDIFTRHLTRVLDIVRKHHLEPMMWSDMLIKLASDSGKEYYSGETELPEHIVNQTPKNVQMVYWDYYHDDEAHYERLINIHKQFGATPAFAGGIWIWNTFGANYGFSTTASEAALRACKKTGVKDIYVTLWGDDGNESNVLYTLAGLALFAEHAYHAVPDSSVLRERVQFITGIDYDDFFKLTYLDETPATIPGNPRWDNPSKYLLWQDPLLGLLDAHVDGLQSELTEHYASLESKFRQAREKSNNTSDLAFVFDVPEKLCAVLAVKSTLGLEVHRAYKESSSQQNATNSDALRHIATDVLPKLANQIKSLREAHRNQWLKTFKPFGWEVLDIRYGGVLSRIDTTQKRITDYLNGTIDKIEELEQEQLFFNQNNRFQGNGIGRVGYYYRIATPNAFFHVIPLAGW